MRPAKSWASSSVQGGLLAAHLFRELVAQFLKVDLAEIVGAARFLVAAGIVRVDGLINNPVKFLEHFSHIRHIAALLEFFENSLYVVVAFRVLKRGGFQRGMIS